MRSSGAQTVAVPSKRRSRAEFEAALARSSDSVDAHAYLGHVWSLLGEPANAEAHLEQAIRITHQNALPEAG